MNMNKQRIARTCTVVVLLATSFGIGTQKISATEAGPSGVNIGFDFSWNDAANPPGHSASFLENDGITANNCSGGNMTATTKTCNFVFDFRVNGTAQASAAHAAPWITWKNPTSYVDGKPTQAGCSSPSATSGNLGQAPLTLFDCFNTGSFGQVFRPTISGPLNQFRMSMTCLAPRNIAKYELYALLYELNPEGTTLTGATPLGATIVNLSKCPTALTWNKKTFSANDFAMIPMSFNNPTVSAGKFYGVYLTGAGMPGTLPPGAQSAMAAAKAANTTTTVAPTTTTTTTTTPWSSFKGGFKAPAKTTPTVSTPGATTTTTPTSSSSLEITVLDSTVINRSVIRLMSPSLAKTYYINSLTPNVCLGAGRNLVLLRTGRCTAQVQRRTNGRLEKTVTTRVVSGTVVESDNVVVLPAATIAYFKSGTALSTAKSKNDIDAISTTARGADAILVTGHTGNVQSENSNLVPLSQKRALAVRSLLRDRGVSATIAIWSYGASNPINKGKTTKAQNLNRRAEIFIIP
jgi:outer membrane protein OmpA-like peptidoglycan-associated protein